MKIISILSFLKHLLHDSPTDSKTVINVEKRPISPSLSTESTQRSIDKQLLKPLDEGILPGDVILLMWLNKKSEEVEPPLYFKYDYGIDAISHRKKLISAGYLEPANPQESLRVLLVPQLKNILRENKLPVSGRKDELIDRIKTNLEAKSYEKSISETILTTSSQGKQLLKQYRELTLAHKHNSKDGIINVATALNHSQKELQNQLDSFYNSENISNRMLSELKDSETNKYQISSTLDKSTCTKCGSMDLKVFQTSNAKFGINFPPFHDGCRCIVDSYIAGLPDIGERWMRNPKTDKGELTSRKTYSEWKKLMIEKYGKDVFS